MRRTIPGLLAFAILTTFATATLAMAVPVAAQGSGGITVEEDLIYCFVDGAALLADVAYPANASGVPAILYIHGGRWRAGSRSAASGIDVRDWAEEGYFAMTISFRLVGSTPAGLPAGTRLRSPRRWGTRATRARADGRMQTATSAPS